MNNASIYLFRSGAVPEAIAFDQIGQHLGKPDVFIWVELDGSVPGIINRLGELLDLHELALEDAMTTHQRPKLEEYEDHLFISAKTAELVNRQVYFGELHVFAGPNYVATIRHGRCVALNRILGRIQALREPLKVGSPSVLYLVLDMIVDHYHPVLESMQDRFHSLESMVLNDKLDRDDLETLYSVKRELGLLRAAADPMQTIVMDLIRLHPRFAMSDLKAYYRDVHDHAVRVTATIDMLRNNASDAMQFYLATLTIKQNESVQKLAGWGAILAVPTVIFSLYGMNFEWMPELKIHWMYPAVLGATVGIAFWLYRHLKKRNWI